MISDDRCHRDMDMAERADGERERREAVTVTVNVTARPTPYSIVHSE